MNQKIKCALCGIVTRNEWRKGNFDAIEIEVKMVTGKSYPECGEGLNTTINICPDCFVEKLVPWVESQGGKPKVTKWDW